MSRYDGRSGAPFGVGCASKPRNHPLHVCDFANLGVDDPVGQSANLRVFDMRPLARHDRDRVVWDHRLHVAHVVHRILACGPAIMASTNTTALMTAGPRIAKLTLRLQAYTSTTT